VRRRAAIRRDRVSERPIQCEQIDVFERWRLVEDLVGGKCLIP
jgi:hypothetical protein